MEETQVEYITSSRSIHEVNNSLAYYNYEGLHFRVFSSFEDAKKYIYSGEESLVFCEFGSEEALDTFLLKELM